MWLSLPSTKIQGFARLERMTGHRCLLSTLIIRASANNTFLKVHANKLSWNTLAHTVRITELQAHLCDFLFFA